MEFFNKANAVRLKSHLNKYMVACEDGLAVRQSKQGGASASARWSVELVEGKSHVIRLRSCHGLYLAVSDEPFLFGVGKRVVQAAAPESSPAAPEWEPIREGSDGAWRVSLRTRGGKLLRANGGAPPWRNSVTCDVPRRTVTQDWVFWEVEVVEIEESSVNSEPSKVSSSTSYDDDLSSRRGLHTAEPSGMDLLGNAKSVRLRGRRRKYLVAENDQESVCQNRHPSASRSKWTVEVNEGGTHIRLKSLYGKYLTATDIPFPLGVTGKKVLQTTPRRIDSSVEWEPIRDPDTNRVRLKTRYGNFLRANGGPPPWRNSITHDVPVRTATQDWVLWHIEIAEVRPNEPEASPVSVDSPASLHHHHQLSIKSPRLTKVESCDSFVGSPMKDPGRDIYYSVVGDDGKLEHGGEESMFNFKGNGVEELTEMLEDETGLEDAIVCCRNPLNGKLYPLRLTLPPNNATMHVVLVPPSVSSSVVREIEAPGSPTSPSPKQALHKDGADF